MLTKEPLSCFQVKFQRSSRSFLKNLHGWQEFYTTAGRAKYQLCQEWASKQYICSSVCMASALLGERSHWNIPPMRGISMVRILAVRMKYSQSQNWPWISLQNTNCAMVHMAYIHNFTEEVLKTNKVLAESIKTFFSFGLSLEIYSQGFWIAHF